MKILSISAGLFAAVMMFGSAIAGEVVVVNQSGEDVRVKCTYVRSFHLHAGRQRVLSFRSSVHDVRCSAHDHHNQHIAGESFHFQGHHDRFVWRIGHH